MVDATGFPGSFGQAVAMVRDGGLVIEVGAFVDMGDEPFNPAVLCGRSLTLMGVGGEDLLAYDGRSRCSTATRLDPVRADGLAPLRGARRARGDGDGARRRRVGQGPDHGRLSAASSARRITAGSTSTPVQCLMPITPC